MLRVLGALLLMGGCTGVGQAQVRRLNRRVNTLRSISNALEIIERELEFRLPPTEELFVVAELRSEQPVSGFFRVCIEGLKQGHEPIAEIWRRAVLEKLEELKKNEKECLFTLGTVLGRYDEEGQRQAIKKTREELAQALSSARNERHSQGKVYSVLGATAGALLVILLL